MILERQKNFLLSEKELFAKSSIKKLSPSQKQNIYSNYKVMEVAAGLALSLLGGGYYLNEQEQKNKVTNVGGGKKREPIGGGSKKRETPDTRPVTKSVAVQTGGAGLVAGAGLGAGAGLEATNFESDILGIFQPEYFDTQNTYSQYKQANPSYQPWRVFQYYSPAEQDMIKSKVNLDQLRQKRHRFPQVKDSVTGTLNSGQINRPSDFSGIGTGSVIDSGNQMTVPHRENVDRECDLTHNNMVPFFGSRVTQSTDIDNRLATHKLELYTGQYNLRQQNKKEVKKLFPPVANLTNVYGSREVRDLSRWFPNNTGKRSNELPFEQIRVGHGLNQGFTARPSGGFHDQIRILPKRNEELFVNPRSENKGKIIYGSALVPERTTIGSVYKYKPTLLVDNRCGQRNFTTVGEIRAPTVRSGVILKSTDRSQLVRPLITPAKFEVNRNTTENLIPCSKITNKQNFENTPYRNLGQTSGKRMNDFSKSGFQNLPNERSVTGPRSYEQAYRALTRSAKNTIKGPSDKAKFTRKQEYALHPRPYGNFNTTQPSKTPVYDPNYAARTTIKETTENSNYQGSLQSPLKKTPAYDPNYSARTTIRETTEDNQNMGSINSSTLQSGSGYKVGNHRPKNTQRQFTSDYEYTGVAQAQENKAAQSYDSAYNAELNVNKECIARGRKPTKQNVKLNKGKDFYNVEIKKSEGDEFNRHGKVKDSTIGNRFNPNAVAECTVTSFKNNPQEDYHRLDPTLLEPFRRNGLTQSLHSY